MNKKTKTVEEAFAAWDRDEAREVRKLSHRSAADSDRCLCHGIRVCKNVNSDKGLGCTLLHGHDGDHTNGFSDPIVTWPRRPSDFE